MVRRLPEGELHTSAAHRYGSHSEYPPHGGPFENSRPSTLWYIDVGPKSKIRLKLAVGDRAESTVNHRPAQMPRLRSLNVSGARDQREVSLNTGLCF